MIFTQAEYKTRLDKTKKLMQEKGIDLLISQDTANMNYLTGYDAWSFYYAQCAIVNVNEDEPLLFVRAQDAGGAYIKSYLKDENIIVYHEKYIHTWPMHPYDYLVELIKEKKWDDLNIGLEMDSHYFTAYCYEKLKQGLPNAIFKDSERLVNWVRVVKSDAEIKLMQSAAKITEKIKANNVRNAALIELLYATGLRVTELVSLPLTSVSDTSEVILVKGKGGKERLVPLSKSAKLAVRDWLSLRSKMEVANRSKIFLFPDDEIFLVTFAISHGARN